MAIINVKVRKNSGMDLAYSTKIHIDMDQTVTDLKNYLYEKDNTLDLERLIIIYCGECLEDEETLTHYNLFDGATVHVYTDLKPAKSSMHSVLEAKPDKSLIESVFHAFLHFPSQRAKVMKLVEAENIHKIIIDTPELSEDPVAVTLLQHFELLAENYNAENIDRFINDNPALSLAIWRIGLTIFNKTDSQVQTSSPDGSVINYNTEEYLFPAIEVSSQSLSRNLSPRPITAEELEHALASITQQLQPSTSGASTSNANERNLLSEQHQEIQRTRLGTHNIIQETQQILNNLENSIQSFINNINNSDIPPNDTDHNSDVD